MTTPSEGQVPRASFAFPSSSSSSSSLLAPAYVPPALPAPHHQTAHYPHAHAPAPTSHSTSTSTSDDDGSSVSSSAGHPLEALVGHARRGDYQARDFAYPVRDEEEEEEEGDPEWVPEGEGFAVRGSAGSSSRGRRKAVGGAAVAAEGAAAGGAGGGGGERTVSEPACAFRSLYPALPFLSARHYRYALTLTPIGDIIDDDDDAAEALEIRWIPSLGKFLPSYVRSVPSAHPQS